MTAVLLPLMLLAPVVVLLALLVQLAAYGPVGWVADLVLLLAVAWGSRALWRVGRRWWASTRAPELPRRDSWAHHGHHREH